MGFPKVGGNGSGKVQIEGNADKGKCEKSPAGNYLEAGGESICVYLYDDDMSPMKNVEVEDLTPSGEVKVKDKETGRTGTIG